MATSKIVRGVVGDDEGFANEFFVYNIEKNCYVFSYAREHFAKARVIQLDKEYGAGKYAYTTVGEYYKRLGCVFDKSTRAWVSLETL